MVPPGVSCLTSVYLWLFENGETRVRDEPRDLDELVALLAPGETRIGQFTEGCNWFVGVSGKSISGGRFRMRRLLLCCFSSIFLLI